MCRRQLPTWSGRGSDASRGTISEAREGTDQPMTRTTRVGPLSNEASEALEETAPGAIHSIVARDTSTDAERYIVFLAQCHEWLPGSTLAEANRRGLGVKAMETHAIDYEHKETGRRADFLLTRK